MIISSETQNFFFKKALLLPLQTLATMATEPVAEMSTQTVLQYMIQFVIVPLPSKGSNKFCCSMKLFSECYQPLVFLPTVSQGRLETK